jgi:hypothetical protein
VQVLVYEEEEDVLSEERAVESGWGEAVNASGATAGETAEVVGVEGATGVGNDV